MQPMKAFPELGKYLISDSCDIIVVEYVPISEKWKCVD